jgi:2-polyprenylphenol 6-hydroxylase
MNKSCDVIIIGGGIIGLSAAIAMHQRHYSVAIIDAGSLFNSTENTRVYALNQASLHLLETLQVAVTQTPYQHMHVWDARSRAHIDFDARLVGASKLGVIVEETALKQALLEQIHTQQITLFPHQTVTYVHSDDTGVSLKTTGHSLRAKLVIVADGAQSKTRTLLGVNLTTWPYHQHALVATVETEQHHQHTAYQVFTSLGSLAFLPLSNPHRCSIVWSTSSSHARALMTLSDDEFAHQLTEAFAHTLGRCRIESRRLVFELNMRHVQTYCGANWLLMGDAAHTIHPLAGLGLNVGLADLSSWLMLLNPKTHPGWSIKSLRAYQRQRKHAVWQTIALMSGLKTLFTHPLAPIVTLRGMGLTVCDRVSPLKRLLIEHATGMNTLLV